MPHDHGSVEDGIEQRSEALGQLWVNEDLIRAEFAAFIKEDRERTERVNRTIDQQSGAIVRAVFEATKKQRARRNAERTPEGL